MANAEGRRQRSIESFGIMLDILEIVFGILDLASLVLAAVKY